MASSRACSSYTCKRSARALCYCCQQQLCLDHLKEHSDLLNAQLTPLADQINQLSDRFNNISLLQPNSLAELDKWRTDAHRVVDHYCERKKRELEKLADGKRNEQKTELDRLLNEVKRLIREQDATQDDIDSLNDSIQSLQQQINQFQLPQLTFSPLIINDDLVAPIRQKSTSKRLLPLSPSYGRIKAPQTGYPSIAANNKHLLLRQGSKLCLLDQQLVVQKEIPWAHNELSTMFWSSTLTQFILITRDEMFTLDEKSMTLEQCSTTRRHEGANWWCGTCSDDSLFLSTAGDDPSIFKYTLRPSIHFAREYRSPSSCEKDETIFDLSSNNQALVLVIGKSQYEKSQYEMRLDLCSAATLERQWSIELGQTSQFCRPRCCSLRSDQRLMVHPDKSELLHISEDGNLVKKEYYDPAPLYAVQSGNDVLAILTDEGVNLHRLL